MLGRGFISSAVPKNYTETPPHDMNHIRRNIDLLSALLQSNGKYKVQVRYSSLNVVLQTYSSPFFRLTQRYPVFS